MYGFYVHAGIDGGTNFIVYATVALSKVTLRSAELSAPFCLGL